MMVILALIFPIARLLLAAEIGLYLLALLGVGIQSAIKHKAPSLVAGMPLAIAVMHLSWGAALLWSLTRNK